MLYSVSGDEGGTCGGAEGTGYLGDGDDEEKTSARDTPSISAPAITAGNNPGREAFELYGGPIPRDAVVTLSRTSGPPGTQLTISGSGFAANEQVELRFHTHTLRSVRADPGGAFSSISIQIPADSQFTGQFDVIASGKTCLNTVEEPFQVT